MTDIIKVDLASTLILICIFIMTFKVTFIIVVKFF